MELTSSSIFLLRGLEVLKNTETIDECFITKSLGFKNAYIADKNKEDFFDCPLYLLFKPKDLTIFHEFVEMEYDTRLLKEDYDYPQGYVVLLYDFPVIFRDDYKKILDGKYSTVSMGYRLLFPEKYKEGRKKVKTLTYHVFNKSAHLRRDMEEDLGLDEGFLEGDELWPLFNMERETLDINKIISEQDVKYIGYTEEQSQEPSEA